MKTYTFPRGGITFEDSFAPPRGAKSTLAFLPGISVLPLVQHRAEGAYPVVNVGDRVEEGALVARSQGAGSSNIHSSIPGRVKKAVHWNPNEAAEERGKSNSALVVMLEGSFATLGKQKEDVFSWAELSVYEIRRLIRCLGVVDMDRSGLPLDALFDECGRGESVSLVIRAVFDDPYLAADLALLSEKPKAVAEGAVIAAKAAGAEDIVVAISKNEAELGAELLKHLDDYSNITTHLVAVSNKYPQKNRRELEIAVRQFEKIEDEDLGELVFLGPSTLLAIQEAVALKKSLIKRYVAIGGPAIVKPQVLLARIGTRVRDLINECGGFKAAPSLVTLGSPLQGRTIRDLDEPLAKTTYAVYAGLPEVLQGPACRFCIACGECRLVCPVGLNPEDLYKMSVSDRSVTQAFGDECVANASRCHGCGC
jgi:electron transport complex protein RnfC